MKRLLAITLIASFALVPHSAYALDGTIGKSVNLVSAYAVGDSANGIHESRHNLGSMGNFTHSVGSNGQRNADVGGPAGGPGGTSEICVFCHTPHHSVSTGGGNGNSIAPAPLWNRQSTASSASFKAYGTTLGGTVINNGDIGGVTLACLSCHDGVTTFDTLANAPGAGGLATPYGTADVQAISSRTWTFCFNGTCWQGTFIPWHWVCISGPGCSGNIIPSNILDQRLNIGNTGGDLSNDHPMSVIYSDGSNSTTKVASLRDRNTLLSDIDLRTGLALSTTNSAELSANLSQNRWAVKGFISDTASINDLLRNNKVECSSCHDPHFKNLSNVDLNNTEKSAYGIVAWSDGLFLRRVGGNAGSGVCRTCHNK